jgi:uncharacterized protein (TIGR03503 family)
MSWVYRALRQVAWLLVIATWLGATPVAAAEPEKADVRVLIDISGSMRQNDPNNLRRPALRMLSGLLQPGTQAGVWTFARWVNNLVPVAEVDEAWKKRVQSLSKQIASPGQFTNIEEVLDKASLDWQGKEPTHVRHLILLTDGMVDVSKTPGESEASRARIIDGLLPRLQADNVKVHTIALSARADHDLMKQLSGETGGWYQQVEQAADLQRVFLKMFEKVGKPDTVPLTDNRFVVDGAVNEATVLAFSKPGAETASLTSPSGEVFKDSDLPSGIAWYRDEGYDMITIASPEKGEWVLNADLDPDNRVLIVTDLKLQTSEIPTHMAVDEQVRVEANLNNRGKVVTRKAFLRLLEVNAALDGSTQDGKLPLNDSGETPDEAAGDGRYSMHLGVGSAADDVELTVTVESPTFMREKRFRMVVHEVATAAVEDSPDGPVLRIKAEKAVMQPGAQISAWQEIVPGQPTALEIESVADEEWLAPMSDTVSPSYLMLSGTTRLGTLIERKLGPIMPEGMAPPPPPPVEEPPPVIEEAPPEPEVPAPLPEPEPPIVEETEEPPPEEESSWVLPAIIFGAFNVVLVIGGLVWFLIRRRSTKAADSALDDLLQQDEGAPADSEGKAA